MDIVERLRESGICASDIGCCDEILNQAADEIERLRGKINKLESELDKKDANADMQYLNGMTFGWNCGLYENNETYETVKKSILLQIRHWRKSDGHC